MNLLKKQEELTQYHNDIVNQINELETSIIELKTELIRNQGAYALLNQLIEEQKSQTESDDYIDNIK